MSSCQDVIRRIPIKFPVDQNRCADHIGVLQPKLPNLKTELPMPPCQKWLCPGSRLGTAMVATQ